MSRDRAQLGESQATLAEARAAFYYPSRLKDEIAAPELLTRLRGCKGCAGKSDVSLVVKARSLVHAAWSELALTLPLQGDAKIFAEGAVSAKNKQLIAVACAHITQCPYCIDGHVKAAKKAGATEEEIAEAVFVAAGMRAGGAIAHSCISMGALEE